ncbi:MAG: hypothetical protein SVR08_00175, partial [Spirochaetota bacterium]|nr:hypothetical protein [Spirochaetota bacterium]
MIKNKLNEMKLVTKFVLGISSIVLLMFISGIFNISSIGTIIRYVTVGDDFNRFAKLGKDLRIIEKNYIARGEEKYVKQMEEVKLKIDKNISSTKSLLKVKEDIDLVDQIAKISDEYLNYFKEYSSAQRGIIETREAIVKAAREMEKQSLDLREDQKKQMLKDFSRERVNKADDANRLIKYVVEIRVAEKNFIMRHEEKYAEELKKILNSVYKQIETTKAKMKRKININQMTRMRNAVEAYEKNFAKNYDFNSIKKKKEESMIASAREFMNITEKGRSIAKKKLESNTNSTRTTLIIFLVIILGISFSIGFLINRTISGGIQKILIQFNQLIKNVLEGKLDSRGDSESVGVDFKGIIDQTNELIDAFMGPLNVTAEYVDRISKGDLPEKITDDYKGDFNEIKNNLNQCIDAISELVADANILSNAAVQGKLDTRADAGKHQGDYAAIVKGVNDTLDAVIGPLNVAAEYVDRISKGDLPEKITDNYNGDFNEIKNNLNMMIENLTNFAINAQTASGQVASGSEQMSSGAQEMAQSASEQSASVEQVSSSMEEMNSSVIQNADNAKETASISEKAAVDAEDGGKSVAETVQAMKSIA